MKKLTKKQQKMFDWDNELRFDSVDYSDAQVCDVAQQAINFAYEHFKDKETDYEGYEYEYEGRVEDVALGIDSHLLKNVKNKKSQLIKQFILDTISVEKYGRGRSGFLFLMYKLKMDEDLRRIAVERKDFWETPRIDFDLLYALYRRRIKGFSKEAEKLIVDNPKITDIKKYARKYIEQEVKWK